MSLLAYSSSVFAQPPEGFDRIATNTNADRKGAEFCYLCIKRDPEAAPITDIQILTGGLCSLVRRHAELTARVMDCR